MTKNDYNLSLIINELYKNQLFLLLKLIIIDIKKCKIFNQITEKTLY